LATEDCQKSIKGLVKRWNKKAEIGEAHVDELAGVKDELAKDTQNYMDYHLNVWHHLRDLHVVLAASFGEVKARCLPFPAGNALVEGLID
jgi:hypothetical protein